VGRAGPRAAAGLARHSRDPQITDDVKLVGGRGSADDEIRITNRHAFAAELVKTEAVVGIVVDVDQKFRGLARLDEVANERFIAATATGIGRKLDTGSRRVTDSRHDGAAGDL